MQPQQQSARQSGPLTGGAISKAHFANGDQPFVAQVLELGSVPPSATTQGNARATLTISDGTHYCRAVSGPLQSQVQAGRIKKFSVIQINEYIVSDVANRKLLIILSAEPTGHNPGSGLGGPRNIETDPVGAAAVARGSSTNGYGAKQDVKSGVVGSGYTYSAQSVMPSMASAQQNWNPTRPSDGYTMIQQLNAYTGGRVTLKLRCTQAGTVRQVPRKRDGEKFDLVNFEFVDEQGSQIKATAFSSQAAQFASQIEAGKVYAVSKMDVKQADDRWGPKLCEFELQFKQHTTLVPQPDDGSIPQQRFDFKPIADLTDCAINALVDVIGVVTEVAPLSQITTKRGELMEKRTIVLRDSSKQIELTVWGERAKDFACDWGTVVGFKNVVVKDFGGRSLSTTFSTVMIPFPPHNDSVALADWWKSLPEVDQKKPAPSQTVRGKSTNVKRVVISDIEAEGLGFGVKPDMVEVCARVTILKHDITKPIWYTACNKMISDDGKRPPRPCQKKLRNDESTADVKRCDRCGKADDYAYRYMFQLQIGDASGNVWVTAFDDAGKVILEGLEAAEVAKISDDNEGTNRLTNLLRDACGKLFILQLRVKAEPKMRDDADGGAAFASQQQLTPDNARVRCTIAHASKLTDWVGESARLVEGISRFVRL